MRLSSKTLLGLAVALTMGTAVAQTGGTPSSGTGNPADAQVGFQKKPQLTPAEQLEDGGNKIGKMEGISNTVRHMLEQARTQRDVVKVLCLNDKLNQIDVAIRSARDRRDALKAAANRNDTELANHEWTILNVLEQRSEQLGAEANQCIGEEAVLIGASQTNMTIDPTLPPDMQETQYPPTDPSMVNEPPICVSCTN
jgi:hypothetical protein